MDNSELRELLAKVPAGKWTAEYDNADHSGGGCWYELQVNGDNPLWYSYNAPAGVAEQAEATAMLLAAAVNALPRILADSEAYARLRAEIAGLAEKWRGDAEFYRSGSEPDKSVAYDSCADELVALLRLPAGEGM